MERIVKIKQSGKDDCPTLDISSNNPYCGDQLKLFANIVPSVNKDLVSNGNFEKGNTDFNPESYHYYDYQTGGSLSYVVSANPKTENGNFGMWFIDKECPGENTNPNCKVVNRVRLLFRNDCCLDRLNGAKIQGSNNKSAWNDLYTFGNATGTWQDVSFANAINYMYVRFVAGPNGYGELREIEFYNGSTKMTGQVFGSPSILGGYVLANATDGSEDAFWHSTGVGENAYVGLELTGCSMAGNLVSSVNGSGKQMAVAASWRQRDAFWSQTILVDPYTDYNISVKAVQLGNYDNVPVQLIFDVDGVPINIQGNISTTGCTWQKIGGLWNSGEKFGPVKLTLRFTNANSNHKLFAIDDISVKPNITGTASNNPVTYSWTAPNTTIQPDLVTANIANPVINNIKGKHAGIYTLTVVQNGCPVTETIDIDVACSATSCPAPTLRSPYARVCFNMGQRATINAIGCPTGSTVKWSDGQTTTTSPYTDPVTGVVSTISTIQTAQITKGTNYSAQCQTDCGISNKSLDLFVHAVGVPNPPVIAPGPVIEKLPGDDGTILYASGCNDGIIKWSNGTTGSTTWIPSLGFRTGDYVEVTAACKTECAESSVSNKVKLIVVCPVKNPSYISKISGPSCTSTGGNVVLEGACAFGTLAWYKDGDPNFRMTGSRIETWITGNTKFKARCEHSTYCVSDFATIDVSVSGKPNPPKITSNPSNAENPSVINVLVGTKIDLTASECAGNIAWVITGYSGMSSSNSSQISITPTAAGQIIAKAKCVTDGCESNETTITINVGTDNPCTITTNPLTLSPNIESLTLALNSVQNLSVSGCNGSLKWYRDNTEISSTASISVVTTVTGNFNYEARCIIGNCLFSKSVAVSIVASSNCPLVSIAPSNARCGATDILSTVTKLGSAYSNVTYKWYKRTLRGIGNGNLMSNVTANITATQDGDYKVIITDNADGACIISSEWEQIVIDNSAASGFDISPTTDPLSLTKGSTQTLSSSGCIGGTVEWYIDNVFKETNSSTSVITTTVGTYTYKATCSVSGCFFTKTKTVIITPICDNPFTVSIGQTPYCGSTNLEANVTPATAGISYKWYNRENSNDPTIINLSTTSNSHIAESDGEYRVEVTNGLCTATSSWTPVTIMRAISATPSIDPATQTVTSGSTATLTASGCPSNSGYDWGSASTATTASITISVSATTIYNVRCKMSRNDAVCYSTPASAEVIIGCGTSSIAKPTLSYKNPTSKVCSGASIEVEAVCSNGSPRWYESATATAYTTGSTKTTTLPKLWATCYSASCESAKELIETQIDFGTVAIVPNCDFNALSALPNDVTKYSYKWQKDNNPPIAGGPTLNVTQSGSYVLFVKLIGTSCEMSPTAFILDITQNKKPTVTLSQTPANCGNVNLTATVGNTTWALPPYHYILKKGSIFVEEFTERTSTTHTFSLSDIGTNNYTIEVQSNYAVPSQICSGSAIASVTVGLNIPVPTISSTITCYDGGNTGVDLTATGCLTNTYLWNSGETTAKITVKPLTATSYKVKCVTPANCAGNYSTPKTISICLPTICNGVTITSTSGGPSGYSNIFDYTGGVTGTMGANFDAICIPDQLTISIKSRGETTFTNVITGACMGSGVESPLNNNCLQLVKKQKENYSFSVTEGDQIKVVVTPDCANDRASCYSCPPGSTAWNLIFSCPNTSASRAFSQPAPCEQTITRNTPLGATTTDEACLEVILNPGFNSGTAKYEAAIKK